jgi:predicted ester cyclase
MNAMLRATAMLMMTTTLGLVGCDGGGDTNTSTGAGGGATSTTSTTTGGGETCDPAPLAANKALALKVSLEVFLANAAADGVLSKDFVAHFPPGQPDQNLQGFLGFGAQFRAALPDAAFAFTHVIADGDLVGLRYIGTGTHKGELFGIPATNKALKWEGMVVRRIVGGLVVEEWNEPDNAGLIGQLTGMVPAQTPASADHQGAGDCTKAVIDASKDIAVRVSKEVVLGGKAPDALISADFVMHNPNGLPDANLQGFLGFNAGFRAAFPDALFTFTHEIGEGGLVLLRYTATGTHSAEFFGVPATGKKIAWEGAVIRRIEGGKAAEEWNAPDIAGIMAQLTAK